MKAPNITQGRAQKVTAGWIHGVNSVRNPWALPEDQVKWAQNCTLRGGVAQTRPGFAMKLSLPNGNFQGGVIFNANKQYSAPATVKGLNGKTVFLPKTIYTPDGASSQETELSYLVFAVAGKVYFSEFPLKQPKSWSLKQLTGIELDPSVENVNFTIATQSAFVSSGTTTVTPSHRIVVIQDGISKPVYWDGSDKTGQIALDVPTGFWMAFSGNRLWVATGNIISASDLGNPLGWTERTEGTGRGDFSIPRPVSAMQSYVGQNNDEKLYVFSDRSTYAFASGVLDRAQWVSTPNFQSILYPTLGCVAGRSICFQAGMMWWYSQGGLISVDVAAASYLSSQVLYKDVEMAKAKRLIVSDFSGIASTSFENYLLCSVPYMDPLNSVTMVLDYASASEWNQSRSPAWAGIWNGIRPVAWANGYVQNQPKLYAFSVDYTPTSDGSFNHVWEAFMPHRYDTYLDIGPEGQTTERISRIYAQVETALLGDGMDLKQLAYGEIDCSQIGGIVDVKVSYRGTKGTYQEILNSRILSATNSYQYETSPNASKLNDLGILQTQHRRLITESVNPISKNISCESSYLFNIDKAFSFLIEWCGSMGIEAVRMFMDPFSETSYGKTSKDETQFCVVGETGDSILIPLADSEDEAPDVQSASWSSTQTRTVTNACESGTTGPAVSATATASYISFTSQEDAIAQAGSKALQEATNAANQYRKQNPCS